METAESAPGSAWGTPVRPWRQTAATAPATPVATWGAAAVEAQNAATLPIAAASGTAPATPYIGLLPVPLASVGTSGRSSPSSAWTTPRPGALWGGLEIETVRHTAWGPLDHESVADQEEESPHLFSETSSENSAPRGAAVGAAARAGAAELPRTVAAPAPLPAPAPWLVADAIDEEDEVDEGAAAQTAGGPATVPAGATAQQTAEQRLDRIARKMASRFRWHTSSNYMDAEHMVKLLRHLPVDPVPTFEDVERIARDPREPNIAMVDYQGTSCLRWTGPKDWNGVASGRRPSESGRGRWPRWQWPEDQAEEAEPGGSATAATGPPAAAVVQEGGSSSSAAGGAATGRPGARWRDLIVRQAAGAAAVGTLEEAVPLIVVLLDVLRGMKGDESTAP